MLNLLLVLVNSLAFVGTIQLGQNLITNGEFKYPSILFYWSFFNKSIPGWTCADKCEINNCRLLNLNCSGQSLDLTSSHIQVVTQEFLAQEGTHLITIQFILPQYRANLKTLLVYLNGQEIYRYLPSVITNNLLYSTSFNVYPCSGRNNITFTTKGFEDEAGFRLVHVSIQRILDIQHQMLINSTLDNKAILFMTSFPSVRVLFVELVNIFISFDRFQFYYFHNRKYSYYTELFLKTISNIMSEKGSFSLNLQQNIIGSTAQKQESLISSLDFKKYSNVQNTDSFISNNMNLIVYSLPYSIFIIMVYYVAFRLTFRLRFSRLFRKYSFYGMVFYLMISEGNIQQYSFYIFGQLLDFFSLNIKHKIVNCAILIFFFIIVACSFLLYIYYWNQKRGAVWCLFDNIHLSSRGMLIYTIDHGVIPFFLGGIHRILLSRPNLQLLVLSMCQVIWIGWQIFGIRNQLYKIKLLIWFNIIEGLLRINFQVTTYLYSAIRFPKIGAFINQQIHFKQIQLFVGLWIIQFIIGILISLNDIRIYFSRGNFKNRRQKEMIPNQKRKINKVMRGRLQKKIVISRKGSID